MDTIIIKPKDSGEYKEVLGLMRRLKIKTEVYKTPTKNEVLKDIENGARSASLYLKGKIKLQDAKSLVSEL